MTKSTNYVKLCIIVFSLFTILNIGCKKDKGLTTTGTNIGEMIIDPGQVITGQSIDMTLRFTVNPEIKLAGTIGELTLIQIDPSGARTELTTLYDNGELSNYDEIKGDRVFSNKIVYYSDKAGEYNFIISTKAIDASGNTTDIESTSFKLNVYNELASGVMSELLTTQNHASNEFKDNVAGDVNNILTAVDKTISWLKSQPNVQDAVKSSTGITITYKSGIEGTIMISVEGDEGDFTMGGPATGGFPPRTKNFIPLEQQTRGSVRDIIETRGDDIDVNLIGNKNVLLYDPYQTVWQGQQASSKAAILKIFNEDKCSKYDVTELYNSDANVEAVSSFTQYGFIILFTHGTNGTIFSTGENVNEFSDIFKNKYQAKLLAQKLTVLNNVTVGRFGDVDILANVYGIKTGFISDLNGRFPNSLIINMSCESSKTPALFNAFVGKGARAYVGFSESVYTSFTGPVALDIIKTVVKDGKTLGEMTKKGEKATKGYGDPAIYATVEISGLESLKLPKDLLNGSFEIGLKGWTKSGDGRYISKLGPVLPPDKDFMGIISTGLGFTTSSGSIFQSFTVPLEVKQLSFEWRLLSEEFLEFIGSQYQDKFEVILKDESGSEIMLISKTIDEIAAEYGATVDTPGSLIGVSPEIKFDVGGVFMTNKIQYLYNISSYQGKCISLEFRCSDTGDSSYDTAVLIDNVRLIY